MNRRSFLKLGALFAAAMAVETSPALKAAAKVLEVDNTQVLLYLIRNYKGQWKVKGTKYIDVPKTRIDQNKFDVDTFRFLGVVENHIANERKLELWKEHNCTGSKGFPLDITTCMNNGINAGNINKNKENYFSDLNNFITNKQRSLGGSISSNNQKQNGTLFGGKPATKEQAALGRTKSHAIMRLDDGYYKSDKIKKVSSNNGNLVGKTLYIFTDNSITMGGMTKSRMIKQYNKVLNLTIKPEDSLYNLYLNEYNIQKENKKRKYLKYENSSVAMKNVAKHSNHGNNQKWLCPDGHISNGTNYKKWCTKRNLNINECIKLETLS